MVPNNNLANHTKPTSVQLNSYAANGYSASPWDGTWAYARVDGQYTGTTDMIIRWAACKWGIDEDVVRAQTTTEHWSWDETTAHGDKRTSYAQCVNGNFTSLWNYQCVNCCYQTWSDWQTKVFYNWMTWPMMSTSTAFGADYRYADQRSCMNGDLKGYFAARPNYNGHNYSTDIAEGNLDTILWGCIGNHYSGNWYDGDTNGGAIWYINIVKNTLSQRVWKQHWPAINWPD
jgi:autotransporter family porin